MDYSKQSVLFKAKKVLRYICMYGPARTYAKVQGHLHMRRRFDVLPPSSDPGLNQDIGIIGCGSFSFSNTAYYLRGRYGPVIGACMDVDSHRAASMSQQHGIPLHTTDAGKVIDHPGIRLIYIASNHASHAEYAIEALRKGKNVYIEKPHVVSEDQLIRLTRAMADNQGKTFLGFNRPRSGFGLTIRRFLDREQGSGMYNWFVVGHEIEAGHWYLRPQEGGRVLGNLSHWTDFILHLVVNDVYPVRIIPARAARSDCDIAVSYIFNDGTVAVITFSAKGQVFEGVKERFSAQKGDCIITMDDYKTLTIEIAQKKRRFRNIFRDHGHRQNIVSAYESLRCNLPYDRDQQLAYAWNTGELFLKTREALETNQPVTARGFQKAAPQLA